LKSRDLFASGIIQNWNNLGFVQIWIFYCMHYNS
jgi:hypothetical protein